MATFLKLMLVPAGNIPMGTEVAVNVEQIIALEPNFKDPKQTVVKLAVAQSVRNPEIGVMEYPPVAYLVATPLDELLKKISEALKTSFS